MGQLDWAGARTPFVARRGRFIVPSFFITGGEIDCIRCGCVYWTAWCDDLQPNGALIRRPVLQTICPESVVRGINADARERMLRGGH